MPLDPTKPRLSIEVTDRDHAIGPADAPVTLVEYGDYECPDCGNAYPAIKRLVAEFGPRLRFVFRNYPQHNVHPHASVAAQAAEAAGAQGRFWDMHDQLYEHQRELADIEMSRFALRLGLEIYKFDADLSSERFAKRVAEDFASGQASGVTGTPTFFINGARYVGDRDYESLRQTITDAQPRSGGRI
ncbi:MAG TPA: DsbA family protein [Tepidisphaeraceae bacterium]